jgi:hypothetical protein
VLSESKQLNICVALWLIRLSGFEESKLGAIMCNAIVSVKDKNALLAKASFKTMIIKVIEF